MNGTSGYLASDMNQSEPLTNGCRHTTPIPHFKLVYHQTIINDAIINAEYPGNGTSEDPYVVTWLPNDPFNPMNITSGAKWLITVIVALMALVLAFVSSAYYGGICQVQTEFGVRQIVATLGIAIGPLVWTPMSGQSISPHISSYYY